jgi:hypothetical protein
MAREVGKREHPPATGLDHAYRGSVNELLRLNRALARKLLTPADPDDLAAALAFALTFDGRKRVRKADESMAKIVARRMVEHLERAGFVVMKKSPVGQPK